MCYAPWRWANPGVRTEPGERAKQQTFQSEMKHRTFPFFSLLPVASRRLDREALHFFGDDYLARGAFLKLRCLNRRENPSTLNSQLQMNGRN